MPSELITQVSEITNLQSHPDADRLETCKVNGWNLVCGKGFYKNGDRVIYITPDSLISETLADELGVKQYLSSVKNQDGTIVKNDVGEQMFRVRQAKLRGIPSFGTTVDSDVALKYGIDLSALPLGTNVAEQLGIEKYEPQMRSSAGDADADHALFQKYTSIENLRNYPNVFEDGEPVVLSEKIHGQNLRIGMVDGEFMAGSHGLRRKRPENLRTSSFWYPLLDESVKNLLTDLGTKHKSVIIYGESYGTIQKGYTYGVLNGVEFRAFDINVDGKYLDYKEFVDVCRSFGVETVPILGIIPYNFGDVSDFAEKIETSMLTNQHGIEGVVVKPLTERTDARIGRCVFKYLTNSYMFNKNKSDYTEV